MTINLIFPSIGLDLSISTSLSIIRISTTSRYLRAHLGIKAFSNLHLKYLFII